ncbi:MAG: MFS transporter [Hyphomonadaceae bacterium]
MADSQEQTASNMTRAWWAVGLFVVLYSLSFLDRHILALLAEPVGQSLNIPDTQMGFLIGSGFGVVYALTGLPLAHFVDRSHRVRIVAGGVTLWSVSTFASAFAQDFTTLLILRACVAVGEAVLSPAAISLIADMFPRDKRTMPTAIYTGVASLMSSGAYTLGGAAYDIATHLTASIDAEAWRIALVLVGVPGVVLAVILLLTVREPPRAAADLSAENAFTTSQAVAYVKENLSLYGCLFLCVASYTITVLGSIAWTPTFLIRAFNSNPAEAGYLFGLVGITAGVVGATFWPVFVRNTIKKRPDAIITTLACAASVGATSVALLGLAPSLHLSLAAGAVTVFAGAVTAVLPPLVIQYAAPGRVRARLMAINLMASSLIGLGMGPPIIAAIADNFFDGPRALGHAFVVMAVIFTPICIISGLAARPRYRHALAEAERREAEGAALAAAKPA